ncbi:ferritin-like domain-containing protein [Gloeothece verrucosa]|uniref:Iminophenyl-pyruvate dimer synthase domain-containing protein n=1 Tax=Gloeothece verrucosa (strain PCC 7822) TaxID=497965 RepID=E0ULS0_GLOV7|nr:ferritin-like protein [Gloeothece verrucosa]ADN17900.1 conserved hypothetical protein [Gloeothece verrucosa PCC 7822]
MVKILQKQIQKVRQASSASELYQPLQDAIDLEHSTIPPYLTAFYSIKSGFNQEIAALILSIVRQEMLHMTIAANVLNAIGGQPVINEPNFIPHYPGNLPGNVEPDLVVGLAPLSLSVVKNIFMRIEQPENPQEFPKEYIPISCDLAEQEAQFNFMLRTQEEYNTIGEFYQAIIDKIHLLGPDIFIGKPERQVVNEQWFAPNLLFAVTNPEEATRALMIIAEQGEGVGTSPLDSQGELAHYYKFSEIFQGYHLYQKAPFEFVYNTAQPIPLDPTGIYNLVENSKANMYVPGTMARRMVDQFNYSYTSLLNGLHKTFNGEPNYLNTVMGLMFDLKLQAQKMAETILTPEDLSSPKAWDNVDKSLAPSFEYASND